MPDAGATSLENNPYSSDAAGDMKGSILIQTATRANPVSSRQDLADTIARVAIGDKSAFAQLYAATSAKMYGIITRIVARPDAAADVLQDVYLRVWQRAADFDPARGSPITWLATIARNRALDEIRRTSMRSLEDSPEVLLLANGDNPLADLEQKDEWQRLQRCLDRLGSERKNLLLQAYFYGMSREEISNRSGRPVSTVKTHLRRSLQELKRYLSE